MENTNFVESLSLKDMLGGFIDSYARRDANVDFSVWLSDKLCQEMPNMTSEESARLASEIMAAVANYNKTLQKLNEAIDFGYSKEEWFCEQLEEAYADMLPEKAGNVLQRMENDLLTANTRLMGGIEQSVADGLSTADSEPVEWNRYALKAKAKNIGKQVANGVLFAAANALNQKQQGAETIEIGEVINDALRDGLQASPDEVKAVVAGAVRVAAEKGLADYLPPDTPIEDIGDLAGVAVEGAEALCDAVNGKITTTEAMDRVGRAGVAAGCRAGARNLKGYLLSFPGGPILVDLLGGLLDHMESSQFVDQVYTAVRGAAIATWEGIKQSKTVAALKNAGNAIKHSIFG